jgi:copper(I)-binding protein
MNRHVWRALALGALLASGPAVAHEYKLAGLEIGHPWTRATPPGAEAAGAFMTIKNEGALPDRLVGASFAGAAVTQIHEMVMENGVMRMGELAGGLAIPPGETVKLEPGGYHVMLMGLKEPLVEGSKVPLTITFEKAGSIEVELAVEAPGKGAGDHDGHQHGAGGG